MGKTTLMQALLKKHEFAVAYESHTERPYQKLFKEDAKYALANQVDYLLTRAEQEVQLRQNDKMILMDGGLDLDFYGFTRLFHAHSWLSDLDLDLCRRFYIFARSLLPPADLIVWLKADAKIITQRLASRDRINIASSDDAMLLEKFINEWIESLDQEKVLKLDVSNEDINYQKSISRIMEKINGKF
ncbi:MAG: putative deoxynucleoside kinase [Chloroflexi bacterium OLB14]|nr:MAG: putative deoxynucleoside kinase [Chloroflexi bacterium OLB14]